MSKNIFQASTATALLALTFLSFPAKAMDRKDRIPTAPPIKKEWDNLPLTDEYYTPRFYLGTLDKDKKTFIVEDMVPIKPQSEYFYEEVEFLRKKVKITGCFTIVTSVAAFSFFDGSKDNRRQDIFHISQEYSFVPFSDIKQEGRGLRTPMWRVNHYKVCATPLMSADPKKPTKMQLWKWKTALKEGKSLDSTNSSEPKKSIFIYKSAPETTRSSTEVTNSIGFSLAGNISATPAGPSASITPTLSVSHSNKFTILDATISNNSGQNAVARWGYRISKSSEISTEGFAPKAQWIWWIDHKEAIDQGLYTIINIPDPKNPGQTKKEYMFSFCNAVKIFGKVVRAKTDPATSKYFGQNEVIFDPVNFLVPSKVIDLEKVFAKSPESSKRSGPGKSKSVPATPSKSRDSHELSQHTRSGDRRASQLGPGKSKSTPTTPSKSRDSHELSQHTRSGDRRASQLPSLDLSSEATLLQPPVGVDVKDSTTIIEKTTSSQATSTKPKKTGTEKRDKKDPSPKTRKTQQGKELKKKGEKSEEKK